MAGKYVFLDRDGVINEDGYGWTEYGYITRPDDMKILPGAAEGIKAFTEAGYRCVVISNQQGVGKGYFTREDLDAVTVRMKKEIAARGGRIDSVYYCTHTKEEKCACRKPLPGLFDIACRELGIGRLDGMYYVGDTERDITAGKAAGLSTVLVLSGKTAREDAEHWKDRPDIVCDDLEEAAKTIIRSCSGSVTEGEAA